MTVLVTGAAGFVGSHMVDRLLALGHRVRGLDNLSHGRLEYLEGALASGCFELVRHDLLADAPVLEDAMAGVDLCIHFAANADVRYGPLRPRRDLEQNTIATSNVLEAMRVAGVKRIAFASTGSVYGEASVIPTPEDAPFPVQTSLYAASKLACEGMLAAYAESFGMEAHIFRFVSILGERYTHGHVFDFCRQLRDHPDRLHVLGDGSQRKSYLYVQDCVDGILSSLQHARDRVNLFNLGADTCCTVTDSVQWITERLGLRPSITFAGGKRGWVGDNPYILLDCSRIRALGWEPRLTIREGIERTVDFLAANSHLLDELRLNGQT